MVPDRPPGDASGSRGRAAPARPVASSVLESADRARARAQEALARASEAEERARTSLARATEHDALVRQVAGALLSVSMAPQVVRLLGERGIDPASITARVEGVDDRSGEVTLVVALGGQASSATDMPVDTTIARATLQSADNARRYPEERRARDTLEAVVQQMPVGVLVADAPDGAIAIANEHACALLGHRVRAWDSIAAYQETPLRTVTGRNLEVGEWPLARTLRSGRRTSEQQLRCQASDGTERHVLVSAAPVLGPNGSVTAAVQVMVDVTARQEAELAREAILGILSHELRTPVTTLLGGSELLQGRWQTLSADERQELIRANVAEAERLSAIIDNMLVLARVDAGVATVDRHPILIQRIVERAVARERRRFPNVEYRITLPGGPPGPVMGDEAAVEQVLTNLLTNAAKYGSSDGRIEVQVEAAGTEVLVRVLDDGPGLRAEEIPELFRLYVRGARAEQRASGAGIGLYVTSRLVAAMDGRLWAANRNEGGAEFGIALPFSGTLLDDADAGRPAP